MLLALKNMILSVQAMAGLTAILASTVMHSSKNNSSNSNSSAEMERLPQNDSKNDVSDDLVEAYRR